MTEFEGWLNYRIHFAKKQIDGFKSYEEHPNPKVNEDEDKLIKKWEKRLEVLENSLFILQEYMEDY